MEQEQQKELKEGKGEKNKENVFAEVNAFKSELLSRIKELEEKIKKFESFSIERNDEQLNKNYLLVKKQLVSLKTLCASFLERFNDLISSEEWKNLGVYPQKLEHLHKTVQKFISLFSGRKNLSEGFIKKLDFILMNEAIKNQMVNQIFEMLNRGEKKEKIMNASLEFVYFLKEIECDETLKELKEMKELIITLKKEEANIQHFLEKLNEKLLEFSNNLEIPLKKSSSLSQEFSDFKHELKRILEKIEKIFSDNPHSKD